MSGQRMSGRPAAARETLLQLLAPVVAESGVDLEDVQVTPAGKRRLVRVVVDADGGIGLDTVALVSQQVSTALDASAEADAALGGAPYVLEVSSPGVDRPLTEPRHWRRARGRLVTATLREGGEVTGRVLRADEGSVVLAVGEPAAERELSLADVATGRVQVEFSRSGGDEHSSGGDEHSSGGDEHSPGGDDSADDLAGDDSADDRTDEE